MQSLKFYKILFEFLRISISYFPTHYYEYYKLGKKKRQKKAQNRVSLPPLYGLVQKFVEGNEIKISLLNLA